MRSVNEQNFRYSFDLSNRTIPSSVQVTCEFSSHFVTRAVWFSWAWCLLLWSSSVFWSFVTPGRRVRPTSVTACPGLQTAGDPLPLAARLFVVPLSQQLAADLSRSRSSHWDFGLDCEEQNKNKNKVLVILQYHYFILIMSLVMYWRTSVRNCDRSHSGLPIGRGNSASRNQLARQGRATRTLHIMTTGICIYRQIQLYVQFSKIFSFQFSFLPVLSVFSDMFRCTDYNAFWAGISRTV